MLEFMFSGAFDLKTESERLVPRSLLSSMHSREVASPLLIPNPDI